MVRVLKRCEVLDHDRRVVVLDAVHQRTIRRLGALTWSECMRRASPLDVSHVQPSKLGLEVLYWCRDGLWQTAQGIARLTEWTAEAVRVELDRAEACGWLLRARSGSLTERWKITGAGRKAHAAFSAPLHRDRRGEPMDSARLTKRLAEILTDATEEGETQIVRLAPGVRMADIEILQFELEILMRNGGELARPVPDTAAAAVRS